MLHVTFIRILEYLHNCHISFYNAILTKISILQSNVPIFTCVLSSSFFFVAQRESFTMPPLNIYHYSFFNLFLFFFLIVNIGDNFITV